MLNIHILDKFFKRTLIYRKNCAGFSLIELLLVMGIILILSVVTFNSLNPAQKFRHARDIRRINDAKVILDAINTYIAENKGSYPSGLSSGMAETQLGTLTYGCAISTGGCNVTEDTCLDLSTPLKKYLKSIPIDPTSIYSPTNTGYSVVDSKGVVTVRACGTESPTNISVPR